MTDPAADAATHDAFDMLVAGLCAGRTQIEPETAAGAEMVRAMVALGARAAVHRVGQCLEGTGNGCLLQPTAPLRLETPAAAILAAGLVSTYGMQSTLLCPHLESGDRRLTHLTEALCAMGSQVTLSGAGSGCLIVLDGPPCAHPWRHAADDWALETVLAVLLAALNTPGSTQLAGVRCDVRAATSRLRQAGAAIETGQKRDGLQIAVAGQPILRAPDNKDNRR